MTFFLSYWWKEGRPQGTRVTPTPEREPYSFKILTDPYHKRYTIEKYCFGRFEQLVYDSQLLDFRKLRPEEHLAWQRLVIEEGPHEQKALIRDMEDRVILREQQRFEKGFARECRLISPHGILLSTHRMYYQYLGDNFNGVILFDALDQAVIKKRYAVNAIHEFTDLLEEIKSFPPPSPAVS